MTYARLVVPFLSLAFLCVAEAATVLKYNCGDGAVDGYDADPSAFVSADSEVYKNVEQGQGIAAAHRYTLAQSFSYELPVGDGEYDVTLIWAEIWGNAATVGGRLFDVAIEGDDKEAALDVFAESGEAVGELVTKTYSGIQVTDGTLTITLSKGAKQNPMLSAMEIAKSDGSDISVSGSGTSAGDGSANLQGFDHQAHSVAGGPYTAIDFNSDQLVEVTLDGSGSHSHWFDPASGETGEIVEFEWTFDGEVIGTETTVTHTFPLGESTVSLKVTDQTGDSASADAVVIGQAGGSGGVYCYFYDGTAALDPGVGNGPKPQDGASSSSLEFSSVADFNFEATENADTWTARCVGKFIAGETKGYEFGLSVVGAATLYIDGETVVQAESDGGDAASGSQQQTLSNGEHDIELIYYKNFGSASVSVSIDGGNGEGSIIVEASEILPIIKYITPSTAQPGGGGNLQIAGSGFFNGESVKIGSTEPAFSKTSTTELLTKIPSKADAGGENEVAVQVCTGAGCSNTKTLAYTNEAPQTIQFSQTFFKNPDGTQYSLPQSATVVLGPDGKYYFGTLSGIVKVIEVNKDLVVTSACDSESVGAGRAILGVAFNPQDSGIKLYVTSNHLYWGSGNNVQPDSWANGKVQTLSPGCGCLCNDGDFITGLPVSNHDHGVNDMQFLPSGDLLILVGGFTNAGHNTPGNKLGGVDENPLSAACVIAQTSKGGDFNGAITYDQYEDPGTAVQTGGDVSVFASGLRNPFGLEYTSDGYIFATDNGYNQAFGDISTSCDTNEALSDNSADELNLLVEGGHYGHPNRNRARNDPQQCTFGTGTGPVKNLPSSSNGIIEYTSFVFQGSLKGDLLVSKYAIQGAGLVNRLQRPGGAGATVSNVQQLVSYSGVGLAEGLYGELVMPRVQQAHVAVLQPQYTPPAGPFVIKVSPRRAKAGSRVIVTGDNFGNGDGLSATFGGEPCTDIEGASNNKFTCIVPGGSGLVSVIVSNGEGSSPAGADFIYA